MRDLLEPYEHRLPEDLEDASLLRILVRVGQVGTHASKQGVVVGSAVPWWRIVARLDKNSRLEYVIVDVKPVQSGRPPVVVGGPFTSRPKAQEQADTLSDIWRMTSVHAPTWPWE